MSLRPVLLLVRETEIDKAMSAYLSSVLVGKSMYISKASAHRDFQLYERLAIHTSKVADYLMKRPQQALH